MQQYFFKNFAQNFQGMDGRQQMHGQQNNGYNQMRNRGDQQRQGRPNNQGGKFNNQKGGPRDNRMNNNNKPGMMGAQGVPMQQVM